MNADSVKARLKNFAVKNGCTFQEALTDFVQNQDNLDER